VRPRKGRCEAATKAIASSDEVAAAEAAKAMVDYVEYYLATPQPKRNFQTKNLWPNIAGQTAIESRFALFTEIF
jgi:hypothetical protein